MSKKINSVELEKIIAEELEKALVDEGFFSRVGAGSKAAAPEVSKGAGRVVGSAKQAIGNIVGKFKGGYAAKKQEEEGMKSIEADLKKIADFIEFTRGDKEIGPLISQSAIGKYLFGDSQAQMMSEQFESQILKMLKTIKPEELKRMVDDFKQKVMANPRAAEVMNRLTGMNVGAEPTQPAAGQPAAAGQPSPTDQTQPAAGQPAAAGSNDQQSIIQRMGDIVAQGRSEQQPVSVRTTPRTNTLIKMQKDRDGSEYVGSNIITQYTNLRDAKKLNIADNEIKKLLPVLIRNRLLYAMRSVRESQEQIKIWQDKGINTEEKLRKNPFFISLVNYLSKETTVNKNKIIPFLIAIWEQGKLVMPKSKLDGPRYTKADIQKIVKNPDYTDEQGEEMFGLEESKRWQELAGILKD